MPATRPIDQLRKEAAALIGAHLKTTTISKAAKELRVSRQALYDIQKEIYCPSLALIQRACEVWNLEFNFRGLRIGKTTLRAKSKPGVPLRQPNLFDALGMLENQQLEVVKTKRTGKAFELVMRLTLSA